jgi:hypothetical protein
MLLLWLDVDDVVVLVVDVVATSTCGGGGGGVAIGEDLILFDGDNDAAGV